MNHLQPHQGASFSLEPEWTITHHADGIAVGGHIDAGSALAFARSLPLDVAALAEEGETIQLDLHELELEDGTAVAEAVNALRALVKLAPVVLWHAPQMLAHTLYKTNMLSGGRLALELPREEESRSS